MPKYLKMIGMFLTVMALQCFVLDICQRTCESILINKYHMNRTYTLVYTHVLHSYRIFGPISLDIFRCLQSVLYLSLALLGFYFENS